MVFVIKTNILQYKSLYKKKKKKERWSLRGYGLRSITLIRVLTWVIAKHYNLDEWLWLNV